MYKSMHECIEMLEEIERGEWHLSAWAHDFCVSLRDQIDAGAVLTPKQREKLDQIYEGE